MLSKAEEHTWGVNCSPKPGGLQHVEFEVLVGEGEEHIIRRLNREKRCGQVERVDEEHYRFSADVFDASEMIPWIRTFICRITRMNFSDRSTENKLKEDIERMYDIYGLKGGGEE